MLTRRHLLSAGASIALAPKAFAVQQDMSAGDRPSGASTALKKAFDRIMDERLKQWPEDATSFGFDNGRHAAGKSRLNDRSLAGRDAMKRGNARWVAELRKVNRASLTGADANNYDAIFYVLQTQAQADRNFNAVCSAGKPYVLDHMDGAYQVIPELLDGEHQISNRTDAEAYLSRLQAYSIALDQEIETVRHDVAAGVRPPTFILEKTRLRLSALRDEPAEQSRLVQSIVRQTAQHSITGNWNTQASDIYTRRVCPALNRQIALIESLQAAATQDGGVWKLPDGDAYYAAALQAWTTSATTAEEIHRTGVELVEELSSALDRELKAQSLTQGSVGERLQALTQDPRFFYPNTDEGRDKLLADINAKVRAIRTKMPQYFGALPKSELQVRRVPKENELNGRGRGYYSWPALDGSRAGIYYVNLRDTHELPSWWVPTLTFHEAVPGHHIQASLQAEANQPLLRKTMFYGAYMEGWALYAEQLADEMGLYESDPFGRMGYLHDTLYRAVRLVVDTGLHVKRWSREQTIRYFVDHLGDPESVATSEIDRYCVWPGQACSYMLGKLTWLQLRQRAKARLGSRFDIRRFHDAGLLRGGMPLAVLERVIEEYVLSGGAPAPK
jgi:uncharacterized protein (DUF885 family)